jgi:hypothetical protein
MRTSLDMEMLLLDRVLPCYACPGRSGHIDRGEHQRPTARTGEQVLGEVAVAGEQVAHVDVAVDPGRLGRLRDGERGVPDALEPREITVVPGATKDVEGRVAKR